MLIDRLFTDPFRRIVAMCQRRACPQMWERQAEEEATRTAELDAGAWEMDEQVRDLPCISPHPLPSTTVSDLCSAWEMDEQTTQRINLTRTLPTVCTLLARFFRRLTVQEPTLQEVISSAGDSNPPTLPTWVARGAPSLSYLPWWHVAGGRRVHGDRGREPRRRL